MRKAFFIAAFVCLFASWAFAQARTSIRVSAETTVENSLVTLGDLAHIAGSDEKAERLRTVSLGYAPNVGMTREIVKEKIVLAISAAGFSPNDFSLQALPVVRIRRAGQEITRSQIREAVEKTILNQFAGNVIEARITRLDLPEKLDVPIGKIEIRANTSNVRNLFAPFALALEIRVNDFIVRRLSANVEIEACAAVLVANKELAIDAKISESDVKLEKRRLEKPFASYLRDTEKLRGIKLIKNLQNGAELTSDSFVAGVVVRSGDLVRIVGQSGKLQITVNGEARTSGKIGDRISVKNSQSNSVVQATVVEEGTVKVFF